jgi:WD40 repeat protein
LLLQASGSGGVSALTFSADGTRLAAGDRKNNVRLWNLGGSRPTSVLLPITQRAFALSDSIRSVAFSPDGARLASGGSDRIVRVWELREPIAMSSQFPPSLGAINAVAFSSDGTRLAAGGDDRSVQIWNLREARPASLPFTGSQGVVFAVAFSPDGVRLAAGGDDKTVRVWDSRDNRAAPLVLHGATGVVDAVAFSPDSSRLVAGDRDQGVWIWDLCGPRGTLLPSRQGSQGTPWCSCPMAKPSNLAAPGRSACGLAPFRLRLPRNSAAACGAISRRRSGGFARPVPEFVPFLSPASIFYKTRASAFS